MGQKFLKLIDNFGVEYNITGPTVQIGSGAERTIKLDEPDILDLHAELRLEDSKWVLFDLSDGRGIKVNGEVIQTSEPLSDGDIISIGSVTLRVSIEQQKTEEDLSIFRGSGEIDINVATTPQSPRGPTKLYPNTVVITSRPPKDRSNAMLLEILLGVFGLLGFGWIYSGNTSTGIAWLIGYLVWNFFAFFIILLTSGCGCFITLPVNVVLIAVSASSLNTYIKKHPELFGT